MSRNATGRSELNPLGQLAYRKVRVANALVTRVVHLLLLCIKRSIYFTVEQPITSLLWHHPEWLYLERKYGHLMHEAVVDLGCFSFD